MRGFGRMAIQIFRSESADLDTDVMDAVAQHMCSGVLLAGTALVEIGTSRFVTTLKILAGELVNPDPPCG